MTPESLQKLIDHYHAVAEAESDMGNQQQAMFYRGKADGVLKVLDTDYPDYPDRVFPFDQQQHDNTVAFVKSMYQKPQQKGHP